MSLLVLFRRYYERSRQKSEEAAQNDTEAYLTLYKISTQDILWRGEHKSWEAFLANEGVPASRWYLFRSGYQALNYNTEKVRELGRPILCRIGHLRKERQIEVARTITRDNAYRLINENRSRSVEGYASVTKQQMADYIKKLKLALKRAGATVPKEPW